MNYFLVLTAVRDLKQDEWIVDEHGGRRIVAIKPYKSSSYITFSEGPSAWYLDSEMLPTERMA